MSESCFDLIKERYVIEIMITLLESPYGFNKLQEELGISTATLQKRLIALEKVGLVEKQRHTEDTRQVRYSLSEKGTGMSKMFALVKETYS